LYHYNGATAANNIDVGIYDAAGTRLVSAGSTAQAGTSDLQLFDVTDTLLGPGLFYFAVSFDGTTGTVFRHVVSQNFGQALGVCQQTASAHPLPATATFAANAFQIVPTCGAFGTSFGGADGVLPMGATVQPWSPEAIGDLLHGQNFNLLGTASGTYPAADLALYVPFTATSRATVKTMWCLNGSANAGNTDIGIYDSSDGLPKNRIVSITPAAQTPVSNIQVFNITDTDIGPGLYYLAIASTSTSAAFVRHTPGVIILRQAGVYQEGSLTAGTLPAVATPATPANAYLPVFGLCTRSVI
jgi:hypothetical protein